MSFVVDDKEQRLARYRPYDADIARMRSEYSCLTVSGIDDRHGLKIVHEARMDVKSKRVAVEKLRKELKADALEYGRTVDAEAKRITQLLEPIEAHLEEQENKIEAEKARIKAEAEAKRQAELNARLEALSAVGLLVNPSQVAQWTREEYETALATATQAKAERDRIAAEQAEAERIERERVAAEQQRQQAELAEQRKAMESERQRLAEEQRKIDEARRAVEVERAKQEAAERARIETEQRIERQQDAARKAEAEAEERRKRIAAERPYVEKLIDIARQIEAIEVPAGRVTEAVESVLRHAANTIRLKARELA